MALTQTSCEPWRSPLLQAQPASAPAAAARRGHAPTPALRSTAVGARPQLLLLPAEGKVCAHPPSPTQPQSRRSISHGAEAVIGGNGFRPPLWARHWGRPNTEKPNKRPPNGRKLLGRSHPSALSVEPWPRAAGGRAGERALGVRSAGSPPGSAPRLARQPPLEAAAVARRSRLLPRSPQLLGMRRTEGEQSNPRGETPRLLVCAVPAGTPIIPVKQAKRSAASALAQHRAQLSPAAAHGWERCLPGKSYSQHSYFWELLLLDTKHLAATEHHTTGAFFPSPPPLLWLLWKN